jgi:hypothetical protein
MRTIALCLVSFASTLAGQVPRDTTPVINVSGEGKRALPPDKVVVQLAVNTRAKTAAKAGADNADRMTAVRRELLRLGLDEKEVTTARYTIHMEMWPSPRDTTYVANNTIQVDTRRLETVSRIIDVALGAGANAINLVQYTLADAREAMRDALTDAVANARLQAEALAAAAGGRLGPLQELNAQQNRVIPYQMGDMAMVRATGAVMGAAETPVSPRDITVTAFVTARWRFIPGR